MEADQARYQQLQEEQAKAWEAACLSCGTVDRDPCEFLAEFSDGKHFCRIYEHRFGLHRTRGGREFQCVPLRNILHLIHPSPPSTI